VIPKVRVVVVVPPELVAVRVAAAVIVVWWPRRRRIEAGRRTRSFVAVPVATVAAWVRVTFWVL
jgi:hypothetical protein